MVSTKFFLKSAVCGLVLFSAGLTAAQDKETQQEAAAADDSSSRRAAMAAQAEKDKQARYEKFAQEMSGVRLIGTFTVDGQKGKLREEEYIIEKVEKAETGNLWTFTCRIKYGKIDVPVPLTIPVEWAGDTPMVGISNFKIPLVGTGVFGARVIFYEGKYAGTWSHDEVGGHMFGRIIKMKPEEGEKSEATDKAK